MQLGIIVNPRSRHHKKNPGTASYYEKLGAGIVEVRSPDTFKKLEDVAREFKKKKVPYIGISGGDGTIHQVISTLIKVYGRTNMPHILLLGDGTMNNIANSIGMSSGGRNVLLKFLKNFRSGSLTYQNRLTIEINNKHCFLFGFGMVSNFLAEVYRGGKKGLCQNIIVICKSIYEVFASIFMADHEKLKILRPALCEIYADKKKLPVSTYSGVLSGTVEKIGMGFRPLFRARESDSKFHFMATGSSHLKMLANMPSMGLGKGLLFKDKKNFDLTVAHLKIVPKGMIEYTMDGDIYSSDKPFVVKSGRTLSFIVV